MNLSTSSIRTFIGAKDYNISRSFYRKLGFSELVTSEKMSFFYLGQFGFYLQDYYVKDWVDNSMIFLEVTDLEKTFQYVQDLDLSGQFDNVRLSPIAYNEWGNEFFLHDPSGVLWHIGVFK